MAASPTSRSLAYCRKQGWHAGVVEKWVPLAGRPGGGIRRDLFGCIDLVVLVAPDPGQRIPTEDGWLEKVAPRAGYILGVQACAGASHAARVAKVAAAPVLPAWIAAGGRVEVWSWTKAGARGKRKLWTLRRELVLPVTHELAELVNGPARPTLLGVGPPA